MATKKKALKRIPKGLTGTVSIDLTKQYERPMEAAKVTRLAGELKVIDQDSFDIAGQVVVRCADEIKSIQKESDEVRVMAYKLHKTITGNIAKACKPFEDARELLEEQMKPFRLAQKAEAAEIQDSVIKAVDETKAELLAEAKRLRKLGKIAEAKALEVQAGELMAPVLPEEGIEVEGLGEREPWIGECTDLMELVRAVADGKVPLKQMIKVKGEDREVNCLEVNEQWLRYVAKTMRKAMNIPGCKAVQDINFATKGSR